MLRIVVCMLLAGLAWACSAPDNPASTPVEPLGARSGHAFRYEAEDGRVRTALLAGVHGQPDAAGRNGLQVLLDEAGPSLTLWPTPAGEDRYERPIVRASFDRRSGVVWLDEEMVRTGRALVWPRPGSDAHAEALFVLEAEARNQGLGGWGEGEFAIRAPDPDPLAQHLDSAQIIEGRVIAVGEARNGRLYLNFGLNWRTDFTASLNREDRERFEEAGLYDPAGLEGAVIRVRGWLYQENGPMIHVASPAQVELVDAPDSRALP